MNNIRYIINKKYQSFLDRIIGNFLYDENSEYFKSHKSSIRTLSNIVAFGIYLFFYILIINLLYGFPDGGNNTLGTFGDFLGGTLNPVFTFLTFLGVVITIIIQKVELANSIEEQKQLRNEYTKTVECLNKQSIENTFFKMIELHNNIVINLNLENHFASDINKQYSVGLSKTFKGRDVFQFIYNLITEGITDNKIVISYYKEIQNNHNHILGHYYRNLFQILLFIDNIDDEIFSKDEKYKYIRILRAQLSTFELAILLINCLDCMVDNGEFRSLLIKYKLLEHLPLVKNDTIDSKNITIDNGRNGHFISIDDLKTFLGKDYNRNNLGAFGKSSKIADILGL